MCPEATRLTDPPSEDEALNNWSTWWDASGGPVLKSTHSAQNLQELAPTHRSTEEGSGLAYMTLLWNQFDNNLEATYVRNSRMTDPAHQRDQRERTREQSVSLVTELGKCIRLNTTAILFSLAKSMLPKSAGPECKGPKTKSAQRQLPNRVFMEVTVTTESVPFCQWILQRLKKLMEVQLLLIWFWYKMKFDLYYNYYC